MLDQRKYEVNTYSEHLEQARKRHRRQMKWLKGQKRPLPFRKVPKLLKVLRNAVKEMAGTFRNRLQNKQVNRELKLGIQDLRHQWIALVKELKGLFSKRKT
jgi:hypothetical protein